MTYQQTLNIGFDDIYVNTYFIFYILSCHKYCVHFGWVCKILTNMYNKMNANLFVSISANTIEKLFKKCCWIEL